MHHKRTGPKSTWSGCLMCKPHKRQGTPLPLRQRHSAVKAMLAAAAGDEKGVNLQTQIGSVIRDMPL